MHTHQRHRAVFHIISIVFCWGARYQPDSSFTQHSTAPHNECAVGSPTCSYQRACCVMMSQSQRGVRNEFADCCDEERALWLSLQLAVRWMKYWLV